MLKFYPKALCLVLVTFIQGASALGIQNAVAKHYGSGTDCPDSLRITCPAHRGDGSGNFSI